MYLGSKFKKEREKKKISLQRVSEELKIQKVFLESMENDEWDKLPGLAYAVGFSRIYSRYLNINVKDDIEDFKNYYLAHEVQEQQEEPPIINNKKNWMLVSTVSSFLIMALVFAWFLIDKDLNQYSLHESEGTKSQKTLTSAKEEVSSNNTSIATISNKMNFDLRKDYSRFVERLDADVNVTEERTVKIESQQKKEKNVSLPPLLEMKILPLEQEVVQKIPQMNVSKDSQKQHTDQEIDNTKTILDIKNNASVRSLPKLNFAVIKAISTVWLRLENTDGDIIFSDVLKPGDSIELPEKKENIILATRNVSALSYEYNGKVLNPISKDGGAIVNFAIKDIGF